MRAAQAAVDRAAAAVARSILAWAAAHVGASRREWVEAMRAELDEPAGAWERLAWAMGSLRLVWPQRRSMTPAGRFWTAIQNTFSFGLVLGVAWLVVVVLSDLVLTNTAFATALGPCSPRLPPGAPCEWDAPLVWGLQPLYFGAAGLLAGRRTASLWAGARVGAATALLGMGALVLTKVVAVDHGLLPSGLALLAVFGVVGTACGACGALVDAQLRRGRG